MKARPIRSLARSRCPWRRSPRNCQWRLESRSVMSTFRRTRRMQHGSRLGCLPTSPKAWTSSLPSDAKAKSPGCGPRSKRSLGCSRPASMSSRGGTRPSSAASSLLPDELGLRPCRWIVAGVGHAPGSPVDGVVALHELLVDEEPAEGGEIPVPPSDDLVDLGFRIALAGLEIFDQPT